MKTKRILLAAEHYCPPTVKRFDIAVEAGFAVSGGRIEDWDWDEDEKDY